MPDIRAELKDLLAEELRPVPGFEGVRNRARRRARRRAIAGTSLLLLGLTTAAVLTRALDSQSTPRPARPGLAEPTATATPVHTPSCVGDVTVSTPAASVHVVPQRAAVLSVAQRDTLTLDATGTCGQFVSGSAQPDGPLLSHAGSSRTWTASRPGHATLVVTIPACADITPPIPGCLGGLRELGEVDIDITAHGSASTLTAPESFPAGSTPVLTRDQAEAIARGRTQGVTAVYSEYFETGAAADHTFRIDRSSPIDETRPVWIVTVLAPGHTDGGPGSTGKPTSASSLVLDGITGTTTDGCAGCAWLTRSS